MNLAVTLLILVAAVWTAGTAEGQSTAQGTIKNFALRTCSTDGQRCLKAEAKQAEGSFLKPIYFMKDIKVTFQQNEKKKSAVIYGKDGYLDFELNRLVVNVRENNQVVEKVFSLHDVTTGDLN